jgi:hypothetical protein
VDSTYWTKSPFDRSDQSLTHPLSSALVLLQFRRSTAFGHFDFRNPWNEVYAIAPVRKFYQKLHREWPYAFFFCVLRGESLMMLTMGCLDNLEGQTKAGEALSQVQIDPQELLQFIMKERAGGRWQKVRRWAGF